MSSDRDRFRVELDVDAGSRRPPQPAAEPHEQQSAFGPFRIALIGDFSGRSNRGLVETGKTLAGRRSVRVDRDTLDDAVARIAPALALRFGSSDERTAVTFASLDDFHPDRLAQRLSRFRALRDAAARTQASADVLREAQYSSTPTPVTPTDILDAILGDAPQPPGGAALARTAPPRAATRDDGGLSDFVQRALAPHLVAAPNASDAELRARVDAAVTAEMRSLLHHPDFQELEAAWRGVAMLVRRLDTDSTLQLHLIDVSRDELAADLDGDVETSGIHRLLVDGSVGTPGMPAWALLAGLFTLGSDERDLPLLGKLAVVARNAGAPFVAGASSVLAGAPSIARMPDPDDWSDAIARGWPELRASAAGRHVALVLPRILLRLPYGERSDACELLHFEEFPADARPEHESYLWGPGSLAPALLLGEAFAETGWSLRLGTQIADLPLHVYRLDGEAVATPCAEVVLSERAAESLLDRGLAPLLTVRDSDSVMLPVLRSIAIPATRLAGRWAAPE
jgi:type VI secretion system protein ImpC